MNLVLALKRSYRYFLPSSLFDLKKLVRQVYVPTVFYLMGWTTAGYHYGGVGSAERVTNISIFYGIVLIVVKWWAGRFQAGDWSYPTEDGTFKSCNE